MIRVIARKRVLLVTWIMYVTVAVGYIGFLVCLRHDSCESKKYRGGRDTVASFGDGRFEVSRMTYNGKRVRSLVDNEHLNPLLWEIAQWYRLDPWVVAIGADREYVVLNYRTGAHASYVALAKAPQEHSRLWSQARRLQRVLEVVGSVVAVVGVALLFHTLRVVSLPPSWASAGHLERPLSERRRGDTGE